MSANWKSGKTTELHPVVAPSPVEVGKRADAHRVIGELVEAAEPLGWEHDQVVEYAIPAENYEALVGLWAAMQGQEII